MSEPRNLQPAERDRIFGPLEVEPDVVGRDTVQFKDPPGPPPLVEVPFGPHRVKVHELAAPSLMAVAEDLERDGVMPLITEIVGFQPRLVRTTGGGNKPVLSAHAYGAAVDVNYSSNPQGSHATPTQAELAPYFTGHGWYWGENFSDPDPHHFTFQGTDPALADEGLTCPVNRDLWAAEHEIPLRPGKVQRWLVYLTALRDATDDQLQAGLRGVFEYWHALFPGLVEQPTVRKATDAEIDAAQEALTMRVRSPRHVVLAEFGYQGDATTMGVPTFVRRRRDRIDPTCPIEPFDVLPVLALEPERDADFGEGQAVEPRKPVESPDTPLGPLPNLDDIKQGVADAAKAAIPVGFLLVGGAAAAVVLYQLLQRKGRRQWN